MLVGKLYTTKVWKKQMYNLIKIVDIIVKVEVLLLKFIYDSKDR